jgi:hypothetical protein
MDSGKKDALGRIDQSHVGRFASSALISEKQIPRYAQDDSEKQIPRYAQDDSEA